MQVLKVNKFMSQNRSSGRRATLKMIIPYLNEIVKIPVPCTFALCHPFPSINSSWLRQSLGHVHT